MIKKSIGVILTMVGIVILIALLTGGGPLWPHVSGPIVLGIAGIALIVLPQRLKKE